MAEGLAVVGMGCRLPGESNSPEQFWDTLMARKDCIVDVPCTRWSLDECYDPDPDARGKCYVRRGGFMTGVHEFDASYFGIGSVEAKSMDPQQRVMMTCAAEALADAGYSKPELVGRNVGVLIGNCNSDWTSLYGNDDIMVFSGTSGASSVISNRISYCFGLAGTSLTVDTACSSTLFAFDLAFKKLVLGEIDVALVGGVNIMLSPQLFIAFSKARMLSKDGKCKTFDDSADGYVRGEGAAAFVLKPFQAATTSQDAIYALIRGTSTNHVGKSASLTAPNGPAQAQSYRDALACGNLQPQDVTFIEAHGTGTALGDPIEMNALKSVYGRRPDHIIVGASKTNIGHLEGSSGAAGVLKGILCLTHQHIPPNLHFSKLNKYIELDDFPLLLPSDDMPYPPATTSNKRMCGISSFGFGGANAHVILEECPPHLLKDRNPTSITARPKVLFMFTGQGSQHVNMGRALYDEKSEFTRTFDLCATKLLTLIGVDIRAIIYPDLWPHSHPAGDHADDSDPDDATEGPSAGPEDVNNTRYAQPLLFAFEVSLAAYFEKLGVVPDMVLGHSLGEYVGAVVSKVMTLEEGLTLVAARAKIMSDTPNDCGVMHACRADVAEALRCIEQMKKDRTSTEPEVQVAVAAINGPKSSSFPALGMEGRGKQLDVSHAFHSPLMTQTIEPFTKAVDQVALADPMPQTAFISTVTGERETTKLLETNYWTQHITKPVRFHDAIRYAVDHEGATLLVELGPKAVLCGMARPCLANSRLETQLVWCLQEVDGQPALHRIPQMLGVGSDSKIAWQMRPYHWKTCYHPVVAYQKVDPKTGETLTRCYMRDELRRYMQHHAVRGVPMIPGVGLVELMVSAAGLKAHGVHNTPGTVQTVDNVLFEKPFVVEDWSEESNKQDANRNEAGARIPTMLLKIDTRGNLLVQSTFTDAEEDVEDHCTARIGVELKQEELDQLVTWPEDWAGPFPSDAAKTGYLETARLYDVLDDFGLNYGERFRTLQSAKVKPDTLDEAVGVLKTKAYELWDAMFRVSPALLDGALHLTAVLVAQQNEHNAKAMIPFAIQRVFLSTAGPTDPLYAHLKITSREADQVTVDVTLFTEARRCVCLLQKVTLKQISIEKRIEVPRDLLYRTTWDLRNFPELQRTEEQEFAVRIALVTKQRALAEHSSPNNALFEHEAEVVDDKLINSAVFHIDPVIEAGADVDAVSPKTRDDAVAAIEDVELEREKRTIEYALDLAQRMSNADKTNSYKLPFHYFLTNQTQAVMPNQDLKQKPVNASLWGFWRSANLELLLTGSKYKLCMVDVHSTDALVESMMFIIRRGLDELQVALRKQPVKIREEDLINAGDMSPVMSPHSIGSGFSPRMSPPLGSPTGANGTRPNTAAASGAQSPMAVGSPGAINSPGAMSNQSGGFNLVGEPNFVLGESDGALEMVSYVARINRVNHNVTGSVELHMSSRGAISNLSLRPQAERATCPPAGYVECRVHGVGLNFRDVLNVMGLYPGDPGPPGGDFAGIVSAVSPGVENLRVGDRVFGIAPGCLKTYAVTDQHLISKMSPRLSFESAAALPVIASTVEYALEDCAHVCEGQKVIIHAITGGVGLSAIQHCLRKGAVPVGTCSEPKRAAAIKHGARFVSSSRDPAAFLKETEQYLGSGGKVDVVLNSLIGDFIPNSLKLLKTGGVFLELGKRDIYSKEQMLAERPDVEYHTIAIDCMMEEDRVWFNSMLNRITDLVDEGSIKPLPLHVFPMTHSSHGGLAAFRFMQRAKHIGKVVISIPSCSTPPLSNEEIVCRADNGYDPLSLSTAVERSQVRPGSSMKGGVRRRSLTKTNVKRPGAYVITGGTGALGLLVANYLVTEGAERIVLLSRSGLTDKLRENAEFAKLQETSVCVDVMGCDVSNYDSVLGTLEVIMRTHEVHGLFHLAGLLMDVSLTEQTPETLSKVLDAKAFVGLELASGLFSISASMDCRRLATRKRG
ncbi:putative polyketide synthase [Gregarina niphandrodes]|uniref:Polyketide synthase n=1 Tax=Gregarina niphandrodes TaxID=110365 RepID=A0A023B0K0_GRENI|nr:putative polyketide synthase [Gregarina niphandrodes]EZG44525.1 putative polyketide synthase [Gregarina niphandrodes]|eukprot:XP_011134166.1 putative polyketide synthase [Gregarina niphandrodes]